jgi:predicted DNA binding protein
MDAFIDNPDLVATSMDVSVEQRGLTRVDRLSGPPAATADAAAQFLDPDQCNDCVAPSADCDAERSYERLVDEPDRKTLYTFHESVSYCDSVPYHAGHELPPGLLFDSTRRGNSHVWRILVRESGAVGDLYDALSASLPAGVSVSFRRLTAPERWGDRTGTVADLSPEQREAIEEAVRMDYYETPRQATLSDLSASLDVPQSTVRYRLRRAEAWLTTAVVAGGDPAVPRGEPAE